MNYKSINPYNGEEVGSHKATTDKDLTTILENSEKAFAEWREVPIAKRAKLMSKAGAVLRENVDKYAKMMTLEMGKPIREARGEVEKCAWVCDYYAENAEAFLADEMIKTDASKSFVRHNPIGCVFAVMPWNFPFWQVFRYAAPTLTAGNVGILKHARNVLGSADFIVEVFEKAGFPKGVFQSINVDHTQIETVIAHPAVQAVTLTGSGPAGSSVASLAGKHIKKSLLELGGSNAFVVLADADLDQAVATAVKARMLNAGQSCIAAKRFIIDSKVYDEFVDGFVKAVIELKSGDPMDERTDVGTLARVDLAEELEEQVNKSVDKGAVLLLGGKRRDAYYEPTVLGDVEPGMAAFDEETFGPLAAMIKAKNTDHAFELAQKSEFALGVSVCTTDVDGVMKYIDKVGDGAFFINELVKSDPRLPFGGQGISGYGRELSKDGILEFVNRKTVYVK